jgi:hypothetical protein
VGTQFRARRPDGGGRPPPGEHPPLRGPRDDPRGDADTIPFADADRYADRYSGPDRYADRYSGPNANTDTDTNANTDTDSDANTDTDSDANTDTDTDTDADANSHADRRPADGDARRRQGRHGLRLEQWRELSR